MSERENDVCDVEVTVRLGAQCSNGGRRLQGRHARGSAPLIFMVVVLVLVTAFATALSTSATSSIVTEARRAALDRAHNAALAGVIRATREMKEIAPSIFKRAAAQANATSAPAGTPVLVGLRIPTAQLHYNLSDAPGATASDAADVTVSFTLAGPPLQVGLAGLPTTDSASPHQDRYTFRCYLRSTGQSTMGAKAVSERVANIEVTLVGGLDLTSAQMSALASAGNIASAPPAPPSIVRPASSPWDVVPSAYATVGDDLLNGTGIISLGPYAGSLGRPPTGVYTDPPVLAAATSQSPNPVNVGQANGDNVTYFKVKGLQGATLQNTMNAKQATILSVDSWRFQSNYNKSLDMIRVNGNYVKGSPEYGVVVLQNERPEITALGGYTAAQTTINTTRGSLTVTARADFQGNQKPLSYNGSTVWVAGVPTLGETGALAPYKAVVIKRDGSLPLGYTVKLLSIANEVRLPETVPSLATQSIASQTGSYGDGVGANGLAVESVSADITIGIVGPNGVVVPNTTATTHNSSHLIVGGGMTEINLSVGCPDCGIDVYPPPTAQPYAQIVSVLWVTMATYSVPDSVDGH